MHQFNTDNSEKHLGLACTKEFTNGSRGNTREFTLILVLISEALPRSISIHASVPLPSVNGAMPKYTQYCDCEYTHSLVLIFSSLIRLPWVKC